MLVILGCLDKFQNIPGMQKGINNIVLMCLSLLFRVFNRISLVLQPMETLKTICKKIAILPFVLLIKFYKVVVSPWMGPKCRYTPTCSQYALDALNKYGLFMGLWKTLKRISNCHPWGGSGYDPA
jgi:putative membrane protein insertion efficiency factor